MAKKSEPDAARALAAAAFGIAAPLAYLGQRLFELSRSGPVDPTLVLRESHTAFYWRAGAATWWAGIVAIAVFAWAQRTDRGDRAAARLRVAVPGLVLAMAAIAWRCA